MPAFLLEELYVSEYDHPETFVLGLVVRRFTIIQLESMGTDDLFSQQALGQHGFGTRGVCFYIGGSKSSALLLVAW